MLLLQKPRHPYFLALVEYTVVALHHPFGKLLQCEFSLLQADWEFAFCTAEVPRIVALISCIILVVWHVWQWGQVRNPCDICFPWFCWRLESFHRKAYGLSSRCAGRRLRWMSQARRCWLIYWMISQVCWRYSRCTRRWRPVSWELRRGEHLRTGITSLVQVISLPRWPITWKSLACAASRLRTVCHVEWRLVMKLRSAWNWRLWRRVIIPLRWMILISVFHKLTVFASGMSWTIIRWFWNVVTALFWVKQTR